MAKEKAPSKTLRAWWFQPDWENAYRMNPEPVTHQARGIIMRADDASPQN